jgi:hypothetical protein
MLDAARLARRNAPMPGLPGAWLHFLMSRG